MISKPLETSRATTSGTSATRRSPAARSLGTPTLMRRQCYCVRRDALPRGGRRAVEFAAVAGSLAEIADSFFRPAVNDLVPYEPGKPVEEVQRELGLERVVKLASNEGQFGPFPEALEAIARGAPELNRYPDGGAYRLRTALAEKHGVKFENVAVAAGADAIIDGLSQAALDAGDEIVCGW